MSIPPLWDKWNQEVIKVNLNSVQYLSFLYSFQTDILLYLLSQSKVKAN